MSACRLLIASLSPSREQFYIAWHAQVTHDVWSCVPCACHTKRADMVHSKSQHTQHSRKRDSLLAHAWPDADTASNVTHLVLQHVARYQRSCHNHRSIPTVTQWPLKIQTLGHANYLCRPPLLCCFIWFWHWGQNHFPFGASVKPTQP